MTPARAWRLRLPDLPEDTGSRLPTGPPRLDPDDPVLHDVRLRDLRLSAAEPLPDMEIRDVELIDCDVAGLISDTGRVASLALVRTRLRGVTWIRGFFDDMLWDGVTGSDVALRFSTLRRTHLRDVSLRGLDLTGVEFDRVRFERCDLRDARFDQAKVTQLRIEHCDLSGATGIDSLRGASIHPDDVTGIAYALAASAGLRVEEDEA